MVNLPNEIIHAIVAEYLAAGGFRRLAPLAAINRNWQIVVESYIWKWLNISATDPLHIKFFRSAFRPETGRRRILRGLEIAFEGYFACPSANNQRVAEYHDDEDQETEEKRSENGGEEEVKRAERGDGTTSTGASEAETNVQHALGPEGPQELKIDREVMSASALNCIESVLQGESHHTRFIAFQTEHTRFFDEVKAIWDQLDHWGHDMYIENITFFVKGHSIYDFLGPDFCGTHAAYFEDSSKLWLASVPDLPSLPSVTSLRVREEINEEMELWPAIVTSKIASTLPVLETLDCSGNDWEQRWPQLRKFLRQALATQLSALNAPLDTLHLNLEYSVIENHEVQPQNFLIEGVDALSRSIHYLSTSLTTLAIRVSYITTALLWDLETLSDDTRKPIWPNLRVLDIATGFERPTGEYWFLADLNYPGEGRHDPDIYVNSDSEEQSAEDLLWVRAGLIPSRYFLTRPNPALFDQLALSIAHAAACMPKLEYVDLEFNAWHQRKSYRGIFDEKFEGYEGWAFYFRASNQARSASTYTKPYWFGHKPGIDLTEIERPRTEWLFQCPHEQVQWEEREEAKSLWQQRSADIDFDVVTFDQDNGLWERRRNGKLILSSKKQE